jgi:hypothetical protein
VVKNEAQLIRSQLAPGVSNEQASRQRRSTTELLATTDTNLKQLASRELNRTQQDSVSQIRKYMEQAKTAEEQESTRAQNLASKALALSMIWLNTMKLLRRSSLSPRAEHLGSLRTRMRSRRVPTYRHSPKRVVETEISSLRSCFASRSSAPFRMTVLLKVLPRYISAMLTASHYFLFALAAFTL